MSYKPLIVAIDLEGCLVPEIWIGVATATGIEDLKLTTRDIPNYDELMQKRLKILDEYEISLDKIQAVINKIEPLPGALDFINWIREKAELIILSDTFYEFADPLMQKMGRPTLFCHTLVIDGKKRIQDYSIRVPEGKKGAVKGFQENGFHVIAIGDSYNDTEMLLQADCGLLFRPPERVIADFPQFPIYREYEGLKAEIMKALKQ